MDDEHLQAYVVLQQMINQIVAVTVMVVSIFSAYFEIESNNYWLEVDRSPIPNQAQIDHLNRMVINDIDCHEQLRMNRQTFMVLCNMVRNVGLRDSEYVVLEEKVEMFLNIIGHDLKNRNIKFSFMRSRQTVSRYFHEVLKAVLSLHDELMKSPEPITEGCDDATWKFFQNCLGALDGTYVKVRVPVEDQPRYRNRKGVIATNVLGVCSRDMQFIYVLAGWEGSASDSRVLRDAIRRSHGLKVCTGQYYLVDGGYTNGEGFLEPYRGQRYHLSTWRDGRAPQTLEEYFNMKHAFARNVIQRCFDLLKKRWEILRDGSYYPIKTQIRIINACCLLHNLIRRQMVVDPLEEQIDDLVDETTDDYINQMEPSDQWSNWRTTLANALFDEWRQHTNT